MSAGDVTRIYLNRDENSSLWRRLSERRSTTIENKYTALDVENDDDAEQGRFRVPSARSTVLRDVLGQIIPCIFATVLNLLEASIMAELLLVTTVISQVVYVFASDFSSPIGTEQCDNIPFFHTIGIGIYDALLANGSTEKALPTFLAAMVISTVLNGILYYAVGYLKLGGIMQTCPRYVILAIGTGFGVFICQVGYEVSTGLNFTLGSLLHLNFNMYVQLFAALVVVACFHLASFYGFGEIGISIATLCVPFLFYAGLLISGATMDQARENLWLFDKAFPEGTTVRWYNTWDAYDFSLIDWPVLAQQIPTLLFLAVYCLFIIPLRIPAFSLLTGEEVNFDTELKCLGIGNILAGLAGSPHNLIAYGNSSMYYDLHGRGKGTGLAVALATFGLFLYDPTLVNFLPRIIASVIMFQMGIDLLIGNLVNSSRSLNRLEYWCTLIIALVIVLKGFIVGMCAALVLSCFAVVVAGSSSNAIHATYAGKQARSDTRWAPAQKRLLDAAVTTGVANVSVVQLRGHLFFGNIQSVIETVTNTTQSDSTFSHGYQQEGSKVGPLAIFVVIDLSFVTDADINAVASLSKLRTRLRSKANIVFSAVPTSLLAYFALEMQVKAEVVEEVAALPFDALTQIFFPSANDALEAFEEALLPKLSSNKDHSFGDLKELAIHDPFLESQRRSFKRHPTGPIGVSAADTAGGDDDDDTPAPSRVEVDGLTERDVSSFAGSRKSLPESPRKNINKFTFSEAADTSEIIDILFDLGAGTWHDTDGPPFERLARYFSRNARVLRSNEVLWQAGRTSEAMALVIRGRLSSARSNGSKVVVMEGTICGQGGLIQHTVYSHTITAVDDSTVALLTLQQLKEIEEIDKAVLCAILKLAFLKVNSAHLDDHAHTNFSSRT